MQRLHSLFQRAALALALLTTGVAGGYALHDPGAARAQACRAAAENAPASTAASQRIYATAWAANAAHADCSCGSA